MHGCTMHNCMHIVISASCIQHAFLGVILYLCLIVELYSLAVARVPPLCKRSAPSSDSVQRYPDKLCCIDCEPNRKLFPVYGMYIYYGPVEPHPPKRKKPVLEVSMGF